MTNVLYFIIGAAIGSLSVQIYKVWQRIRSIEDSLLARPKTSPAVTSGSPALVRPERVNSSAVISPKTPQMIDFEENEEIRRLNPGS